tara:strand:+ start:532 stop:1194 length:663 start_codon:yes stop_codon:yes gene_type:complete
MSKIDIEKIITKMQITRKDTEPTAVESFIELNKKRNPFKILISTIISLRTKDEVTYESSKRLFKLGSTPRAISKLPTHKIQTAIYPCGFFRNKAKTIKEVSKKILYDYNGKTPNSIQELLKFKGVGRKTANLVVILGYNKPGICVDTHVHRIFNRIGYVQTQTPNQTEFELRKKLPLKFWLPINSLLVFYGQKICRPISPICSRCSVNNLCKKVGVHRKR